ncbi:MAG: hypothetical protein Q9170_000918 [Blastenia crenularia]
MTFPPERITVKRRRDEEPVDALYFPPQKSRRTVIWNRVSVDRSSNEIKHQTSAADKDRPNVPAVRTTLPDADIAPPPSGNHFALQRQAAQDAARSANRQLQSTSGPENILSNTQACPPIRFPKEPRKFHLARSSNPTKNLPVLHGGIRKLKKKQKRELAVFIERTGHAQEPRHHRTNSGGSDGQRSKPMKDVSNLSPTSSNTRKRPLVSDAERNWRVQSPKQSLENNPNTAPAGTETNGKLTAASSLRLAHQLQQFAMEVTGTSYEAPHDRKQPNGKVKPKPSKTRPAKVEVDKVEGDGNIIGDIMDISSVEEDPKTFIYDVYVRQAEYAGEHTQTGLHVGALEKADPARIGVLVIEDEAQETWELYGDENQSSDDDWNSEEEDENGQNPAVSAEDYYGNDYPEDELDSDDEHDKDTYKHWHSPFDEEELEDNINWSDDEPAGNQSWKYR